MMLHASPVRAVQKRSLLSRRRAQFVGALIAGALLPYLLRTIFWPGTGDEDTSLNALAGNAAAVVLALWVRMSVEKPIRGCGRAPSTCRSPRGATWA